MLPETLWLADYGLGHDDRAKEHQPVASRLGARFYDWQLAQSPEESWWECHLHARNLLGRSGYLKLLGEVLRDTPSGGWEDALCLALDPHEKAHLCEVFSMSRSRRRPIKKLQPATIWNRRTEWPKKKLHIPIMVK